MADEIDSLMPLSPLALHILLALSRQTPSRIRDHAGSGQSDGRYKPGPETLYDNLQRLEQQGVVAMGQAIVPLTSHSTP